MGKVTVLLTHAEDKRFTAYCHKRGYKKSTLIARLMRDHLDREKFDPPINPEETQEIAGDSEGHSNG